jgi:hypothetical protein
VGGGFGGPGFAGGEGTFPGELVTIAP